VEKEIGDLRRRLSKLYDALETEQLSMKDLAPRIQELRQRQDQLEAGREEAQANLR